MTTSRKFYAMDTGFYFIPNSVYAVDLRYEITKLVGYDAAYLTLPDGKADSPELRALRSVQTRWGLPVAAVFVAGSVRPENPAAERDRLKAYLEALPVGCDLEYSVWPAAGGKPSDAALDGEFLKFLEPILAHAAALQRRIVLYPHVEAWIETVDDAVRLCRQVDSPFLRAAFCGYHWFAADAKGAELPDKLRAIVPWLGAVNLSGSRKKRAEEKYPPLLNLESGTLDNFAIYAWLRAVGYDGRVGVQAFSVGGDVVENYRKSLAALRRWEAQCQAHPDWTARIYGVTG